MPYYTKKTQGKSRGTSPSLSALVNRLDTVFSKYIRLRDTMPGGVFRCISCGKIKPVAQADAGHYHSRRHMGTRFSEDNVHAECRFCNRFSADHNIGFRENLVRKIGPQRFAMLETEAHRTRKFSHFEIREMTRHYRSQVVELQKEKGIKL